MVGLQAQEATAKKACTKGAKACCASKAKVTTASLTSEGFSDVKVCEVSGKVSGTKTCAVSGTVTQKSFNPSTKEVTVTKKNGETGEVISEEITVMEAKTSNAALAKAAPADVDAADAAAEVEMISSTEDFPAKVCHASTMKSEGFDVSSCPASGKITGTKTCSTSGTKTTKVFNPETSEMTVTKMSEKGEVISTDVTLIEAASANPAAATPTKKSCAKSCAKKCSSKNKK